MDPFLGEIRIFAGTFAPLGWALCDGQLLSINSNTALFSLLGTNYGGDGRQYFGLPNLQGKSPLFFGQGPGLSLYDIGDTSGSSDVTVLQNQLPEHNHEVNATSVAATSRTPTNNIPAFGDHELYSELIPTTAISPNSLALAGGSQPHNNLQPSLVVNFIIATEGIFPTRS